MYGVIEIGGQKYIERFRQFPATLNVTANNQVFTGQNLVLPGVANFLLKGLVRETEAGAPPVPAVRRFLFRFGNSDGNTWYTAAGLGGASERVLDSLIFGDGQFPFPIIPHVFYSASASIMFEVEDISANVPYTIRFGFIGSYLVPV